MTGLAQDVRYARILIKSVCQGKEGRFSLKCADAKRRQPQERGLSIIAQHNSAPSWASSLAYFGSVSVAEESCPVPV
jgi:hypothetical protein